MALSVKPPKKRGGGLFGLFRSPEERQLSKIEKELKVFHKTLLKKEALLTKREDELKKFDIFVSTKAKDVKQKEAAIKHASATKKKAIKEIESLQRQAHALNNDLARKSQELTTISKELRHQRSKADKIAHEERTLKNLKDKYENLLANLDAKEKQLKKVEYTIAHSGKSVKLAISKQRKFEKELASIEKEHDANVKALKEQRKHLHELLKQDKKFEKKWKKQSKILTVHEKELDAQEKELEQRSELLKKKGSLLDKKESALEQEERAILAAENKIKTVQQQLTKRESQIIAQEEHHKSLKKEIAAAEAGLKDYEKKLSALKKRESVIEKKESDLIQREKVVASYKDEEAKLQRMGAEVEEKRGLLSSLINTLKVDRHDAEMVLKDNQETLAALEAERTNKFNQLKENKAFVESTLAELDKLAKQDIGMIQEKEKELMGTVRQLEGQRIKLVRQEEKVQKAETKFKEKEDRFARWENEIREKRKDLKEHGQELTKFKKDLDLIDRRLTERELKVAKAKELKANISKLQGRYDELKDLVKHAEAKVMGFGLDFMKRREFLKDMESEVVRREKQVEQASEILQKRAAEIQEEAEDLLQHEEEIFAQAAIEGDLPARKVIASETNHPDIHGMIKEAKLALQAGDLNKAVRLTVQVDLVVDKLSDKEKRALHYDVEELKTNIKLASLV